MYPKLRASANLENEHPFPSVVCESTEIIIKYLDKMFKFLGPNFDLVSQKF